MIKNDLIQKYFNKTNELSFENKTYKTAVDDLTSWLLDNDKVEDDITTNLLFDKPQDINAHIVAKQDLIISGIDEVEYLLQEFTNLDYEILFNDGDKVGEKVIIAQISGDVKEVLAYERVILNILQRLSGIATETRGIVDKIKRDKPKIAATRKTPWGFLDKKAVANGGGITHRLNLANNILVKDNHLMLISPKDALNKILEKTKNTLIEIEVDDEKTITELIDIFSKEKTTNTLAILLDNFSPQKVKKILSVNKFPYNIIFEASGGITKENIDKWVDTGVDIISLGSLTHSPKAADISLDVIR